MKFFLTILMSCLSCTALQAQDTCTVALGDTLSFRTCSAGIFVSVELIEIKTKKNRVELSFRDLDRSALPGVDARVPLVPIRNQYVVSNNGDSVTVTYEDPATSFMYARCFCKRED